MLNLTRGLGTALGIAATTLVHTAAGGVTAVALFLGGLTALGACLSGARTGQPTPPPIR